MPAIARPSRESRTRGRRNAPADHPTTRPSHPMRTDMMTQLTPTHMDLPPPVASDLAHDGRSVGWLGADSVGFRGFAGEDEAMAAAWMAYRTLARHLARRGGTRLAPV